MTFYETITLRQEEFLIERLGFKGGGRFNVTKRMDSIIPRKTEKKGTVNSNGGARRYLARRFLYPLFMKKGTPRRKLNPRGHLVTLLLPAHSNTVTSVA
jgi:hypothetical protein